ncbi:unnamed protein product [Clonostachys rhizophaga]|uniref:Uncharacterized protein n=1 Tax=Clonostachys rhizophaga TaxID=160324 RepID=A0A9N9VL16_9HYPO|nr:unnamed protein product [Clonostachys rhizophaga]
MFIDYLVSKFDIDQVTFSDSIKMNSYLGHRAKQDTEGPTYTQGTASSNAIDVGQARRISIHEESLDEDYLHRRLPPYYIENMTSRRGNRAIASSDHLQHRRARRRYLRAQLRLARRLRRPTTPPPSPSPQETSPQAAGPVSPCSESVPSLTRSGDSISDESGSWSPSQYRVWEELRARVRRAFADHENRQDEAAAEPEPEEDEDEDEDEDAEEEEYEEAPLSDEDWDDFQARINARADE